MKKLRNSHTFIYLNLLMYTYINRAQFLEFLIGYRVWDPCAVVRSSLPMICGYETSGWTVARQNR